MKTFGNDTTLILVTYITKTESGSFYSSISYLIVVKSQ